jgi:hypothetical protein
MFTLRRTLAAVGALTLAGAGFTAATGQVRTTTVASAGVHPLTGTYELDQRLSDDPHTVVERAALSVPAANRERVSRNWLNRLGTPAALALEVRGQTVTMASSARPQLSFQADGRNRTEAATNGRTVTTNAALRGNRLVVSSSGNRGADYRVTFEPVAGGIRVTRQLDAEARGVTVVAQSFYRRVGEPRWNVYDGSGYTMPSRDVTPTTPSRGVEYVAHGTRLIAHLDAALNADEVRAGQRVTFTVRNNGPYEDASIEGIVTRSGSRVGIEFETIRLTNGRSAPYDAVIETVRTPDGETIRVQNASIEDERSRSTSRNVERGAIGAGIGAIIGAIVGGDEGALVGALAGGAGLILMDPKTDQRLPAGTEFIIATVARPR